MNDRLRTALRLAFGVALLAFLLTRVDLRATAAQIAAARVEYLLAAAAAFAADRVLMAYKWNLLLRARGIEVPLATALRLVMVGNLFGLITPGSIGLDVYRVTALAAEHRARDVAATAIVERLIGLGGLAACVALALPFSASYLPVDGTTRLGLIAACLAVLGLIALALVPAVNRRVFETLPLVSGRLGAALRRLLDSYNASASDRPTLARFAALTLVEVLAITATVRLASLALDVRLAFPFFAVVVPIALLLQRLPVSLDGLGVTESVYVVALRAMGYPGETGLALGLLVRAVRLAVGQIPAAIWMLGHRTANRGSRAA